MASKAETSARPKGAQVQSSLTSTSELDTLLVQEGEQGEHGASHSTMLPALTVLYHPAIERIGEQALLGELASGTAVSISRIVIHSRGRSHAELPFGVERWLTPAPPSGRRVGKPAQVPSAISGTGPVPPIHAWSTPKSAPANAPPAAPLTASAPPRLAPSEWRRPGEVTEEELDAALREARWDRTAAAALLRMSKTSLYEVLEKYPRFPKARDLTPEQISQACDECNGDIERMVERLQVSERALRQRLRDLGIDRRSMGAAEPKSGDGRA